MPATIRPDTLKVALDAKIAAAATDLVELREAEELRVTPHLSPREIIGALLSHARGVYPIADTFGKAQAGDLVFNAWYQTWRGTLSKADLSLWAQLRADRVQPGMGRDAELIEDEIAVAADPTITVPDLPVGARTDIRKRRVRFAAHPNRAASEVCGDYVRLARRFADDFIRDNDRFLK